MTRLSQTFLPTLKDPPADAEALSHKLMVRAGLIRQLGAGLWTYLPAGWRVERKVEAILREEMEAIGCQEMLMPVLQPAENWEKTGRYAIDELFKLEDRKGSPMVLAMTHEEAVTYHVAREVRSYRDLPLMLFHLQTKERDEPRPRAGVLRTREFTMKDAYSFDRDEEGLARSYELQAGAYERIFDRCGLRWYRVESDVGMMGGSGAHEYMAPCAAGENEVALAPGYAANVEVASADPQPVELPAPLDAPEEVSTPGLTKVEEVSGAARASRRGLDQGDADHRRGARDGPRPAARRPPAQRDQAAQRDGHRLPPGRARRRSRPSSARSATSARSAPSLPIIKDAAIDRRLLRLRRQPGRHPPARRRPRARLRVLRDGRAHGRGRRHRSRRRHDRDRAGDRGRQHLQARHPLLGAARRHLPRRGGQGAADRDGQLRDRSGADRRRGDRAARRRERHRLAARRSRPGTSTSSRWPRPGSRSATRPTASTRSCATAGAEVLYDDRDAGPGEKLTDAELLGCPLRIVVGRRGLAEGVVEATERASGAEHELPVEEAAERALALLQGLDA